MTDKPVIGQVGRTDRDQTIKVEILGELKREEWQEFVDCLKACASRFPRLKVKVRPLKVNLAKSFPLPGGKKKRKKKK